MHRVGQNRILTPYMTVYLVISLPKIPYMHRIYMVLANPTNASCINHTQAVNSVQHPSLAPHGLAMCRGNNSLMYWWHTGSIHHDILQHDTLYHTHTQPPPPPHTHTNTHTQTHTHKHTHSHTHRRCTHPNRGTIWPCDSQLPWLDLICFRWSLLFCVCVCHCLCVCVLSSSSHSLYRYRKTLCVLRPVPVYHQSHPLPACVPSVTPATCLCTISHTRYLPVYHQ